MVDYLEVLHRYIPPSGELYRFYLPHASAVTAKALAVGRTLGFTAQQLRFIEEAAMLHDIGVVTVNHPALGCHGDLPYLRHGVEGRRILEEAGLPAHGRVAENHVGAGILADEVRRYNLPLPERDMAPETVDEELICWADAFFSKSAGKLWQEKPLAAVEAQMASYSPRSLASFQEWTRRFG